MRTEYEITQPEDIDLLNGFVRDCSFNIEELALDTESGILKIRYGYLDSENASSVCEGAVSKVSVPVVEGFIYIHGVTSFKVVEKSGHGPGEMFIDVDFLPEDGVLYFSTMFARGIEVRVDALDVRVVITDAILGYREVSCQI